MSSQRIADICQWHPIIRITTKCTQSCEHCCFSCSPSQTRQMSVEMAQQISDFLNNHHISTIEIMGGEFICNPNWYSIVETLSKNINSVRLVSNGDWLASSERVIKLLKRNKQIKIAISKDKYHTNQNYVNITKELETANIPYVIQSFELNEYGIVPIGRAQSYCGFYSYFGCYCKNPKYCSSCLVDEDGDVFYCPFGAWRVGNIQEVDIMEYLRDFNSAFDKSLIMSCSQCLRVWSKVGETKNGRSNN